MCGRLSRRASSHTTFSAQIFTRATLFRLEQKPFAIHCEPEFALRAEILDVLGLRLINLADGEHGALFDRHAQFASQQLGQQRCTLGNFFMATSFGEVHALPDMSKP
ncbi:MAG: hypothetical protein KA191_06200 [Verrucomicrobia bacterium]|jgi:hypothetical protein|nr:hypothetical protein [Verrucomicrobiota bacterium]NMD19442.1 hypothetical protein [Verrucomicrobiota bacterium]HOF48115.1 hypothetical protein [Verrucomicrobiota bacterium]HOR71264.1 hypothetical protein [Verrucomicrobiota bacterium]HOU87664.1 hypothetical protein [Verrucomicrobiota bacterium]